MKLPVVPLILVSVLVLPGCARSGSASPGQDTAAVAQEQARIASVLVHDNTGRVLSTGTVETRTCKVQLLRMTASDSYVWAFCTERAGEGASFPVAVDSKGEIRVPGDGSLYASSIREIFPRDLAKKILDDGEDLAPA